MTCKGYYLSDKKGTGRFEYYLGEELSGKYYHTEIKCTEKAEDLCAACMKREAKLKTYVCPSNVLKVSVNGIAASHNNIFHRRIGEPIPPWSNAENGERHKQKLLEGYSKEMVKTVSTVIDEKILEFVMNLKGTIPVKMKKILATYPKFTQADALSYIKVSKNPAEKSFVVDPVLKDEAFEIVKVPVRKIKISNKEYLYEPNKQKVYSLDFKYVGRYNKEVLYTEYPDSDSEPVL